MVQRQRLLAYTQATAVQVRPGLLEVGMRNEKRFLRTLKRDIKRTGNRKRRRFLKNIDASPEDFDLGRDRTDVMNERPREKPKRWDRNNTEIEA